MSDVIYDVAIVGGGLAGLNAALSCQAFGLTSVIIEASDDVGGKLRTDEDADGFLYDRGFQVFFSAYDELPWQAWQHLPPNSRLLSFQPGAKIVGLGIVSKQNPLHSIACKALNPFDLARLLSLNFKSAKWDAMEPDQTTAQFLAQFGFSSRAVDCFFRPFYGGISLDRGLNGSARQFLKTWSFLSRGSTATFQSGIREIPQSIAAGFNIGAPGQKPRLILNSEAVSLEQDQHSWVIRGSEIVRASSVVLAAGATSAQTLIGLDRQTQYKHSICLYFASDQPVSREKLIILNPAPNALVNQLVPLSNVNPNCAPVGKHLCSATIIGDRPESDEELAQMAIAEMSIWGLNLPALEFKRAYRIKEAQLQQEPGFEDRVPSVETHLPGVFLAGEMTTSSSINDALKSGRLAAEAALAYLKNK